MTETVSASARTCAGCRQLDDRDALLRFVADGDPPRIAPDVRRRAPGRGVSVHPRYRCVHAAVRNGALKRGLGVGSVETARDTVQTTQTAQTLSRSAAEQYLRRADGLLGAGHRARKLAVGTEAVRVALNERRVEMLLVADDAEGDREELSAAAQRLGRSCLVFRDRESLGRLFGRSVLALVGVLDAGIAAELRHVVQCATDLAEDA
jgi:predicted RNA-binding protein YlxR (DUF448 family)